MVAARLRGGNGECGGQHAKPDHMLDRGPRVTPDLVDEATHGETAGAQTLRRGLAILKLLARYQPSGLRISDIGRRLDFSKATAVRLTRTLVDEKFVTHDPVTRHYRLGPESFAIGLAAEPTYALQRIAAPALRSFALETGDWVFFSVMQGFESICLSRETGDIPYPATAVKVGDRHPLGVGAGALAMLAALPDDEVDLALAHNAEVIRKKYPRSPPDVIRQLVRETREKGYCVIPGIIVPGYWALGVPLVQQDGRPVAAIVLVTSETRLNVTRRAVLGERLLRIARDVMARADHAPSALDDAEPVSPRRKPAAR